MQGAACGVNPTLLFFFRRTAPEREEDIVTRSDEKENEERRLFCAACRHLVTHQDERIAVNGSHAHRCTNPAGIVFDIGCFREAAGCAAVGTATIEHTWFRGYAWRVALCAGCGQQLGWRFDSGADRFHGLILDRLTSAGGGS